MTPTFEPGPDAGVSERVIRAIAAETEADVTEMDPLYDAVDPECLDELFPIGTAAEDPNRQLRFTYEDHVVTVSSDGRVDVVPEGGRSPDHSPSDSTVAPSTGNTEAPD